MSLLPKNRRLARAALCAAFGVVLVARSAATMATPAPEQPKPPAGPEAGQGASTGGGGPLPPEPASAAPPASAEPPPTLESPPPSAPAEPVRRTAGPTAAADADALDAEAAAQAAAMQEAGGAGSQAGGEPSRLSFYGFSDFTYTKPISALSFNPDASFAVGNLNLYMGADLGRGWRSLVEVRFMYLPDGSRPLGVTAPATDTTASDYTNDYRPIKWGGINIQRAWVEWTLDKLLTVRLGQFLTPYGIWNVDHGSPVFIGVTKPYIVGQQFLPESQTGIEIYGTTDLRSTQLGYHLTLSNGRGPIETYQDLDSNKALGGRVFAKNESGLGTLSIGGSLYYGRYTDKITGSSIDPNTHTLTTVDSIITQYDELSLAADLKWQLAGLLVQGELIMNQVAYVNGGRPPYMSFSGGPAGFTSDFSRWGGYGLVGYRLPFWGIMPFAELDYYKEGPASFVQRATDLELGVNVRITPSIVFKGQYSHVRVHFFEANQPLQMARAQIAWSF